MDTQKEPLTESQLERNKRLQQIQRQSNRPNSAIRLQEDVFGIDWSISNQRLRRIGEVRQHGRQVASANRQTT